MGRFVVPEEYRQYFRTSEFPGRDAFYNWLVTLHAKKGKPWTTDGLFSDKLFWNTFLDHVLAWIPTLIFLYFTYFIVNFTYDRYGEFRAFVVLAIFVLIRLNSLIRQTTMTNRLLKRLLDLK